MLVNVRNGEYLSALHPLAIAGISATSNRFDMIHAQIKVYSLLSHLPEAPEPESSTTSD